MATIVDTEFDVMVIGGGVKGSAIARDAVGRGLRVLLCEQGDLGSSCIKSLARLGVAAFQAPVPYTQTEARKACQEWDVLRRISPHLSQRATTPQRDRGFAKILDRFRNPNLSRAALSPPLQSILSAHRFVMVSLRDAAERGAIILPRTRFLSAKREQDRWTVVIRSVAGQDDEVLSAKILVDTTGGRSMPANLRQSNRDDAENGLAAILAIIKLEQGDSAQVLDDSIDGGRFFSLPLENGCRLIGLLNPRSETKNTFEALLARANQNPDSAIKQSDVLWQGYTEITDPGKPSHARPEIDNFHIHIQTEAGKLPLFQITGGTVSVARRLAEEAVAEMTPFAKMIGKKWTRTTALPGGDFQPALHGRLLAELQADYPFLATSNLRRMFGTYGTDCRLFLGQAKTTKDLGVCFGDDLFEAEVRWLVQEEWARTAEDIVWRRTRLGQQMTAEQITTLDVWLKRNALLGAVALPAAGGNNPDARLNLPH